ncbi:hypothetical protein KIPB_005619, partial [Kipferlia bialata]|eukprot:g5619.t1
MSGNVGAIQATAIVLICKGVTFCTSLSLSAVATNGHIGNGGIYYMVSRSLGPAWGGAIGLMYSIAGSISVSMYILGFIETLVQLTGISITGDALTDVRIMGTVLLVILLGIVLVGVGWVVKTDMFLLVVLLGSVLSIFIGAPLGNVTDGTAYEDIPLMDTLIDNLSPSSADGALTFMAALGIFFPAVTGIMAGANISGSLENPSSDIPKGTLLAISSGTGIYLVFLWLIAMFVPRALSLDESGFVMGALSVFQPLVYGGVFASSLSAGLSMLVSAPRVLQNLAKDGTVPLLNRFAKGVGKDDSPLLGTLLTCVIAFGCIMIGELNSIAPIISNLFLVSYGLINYAVALAASAHSPQFRPSFQYWNRYSAWFGAALCVSVMVIMAPATGAGTLLVLSLLYLNLSRTGSTALSPEDVARLSSELAFRISPTPMLEEGEGEGESEGDGEESGSDDGEVDITRLQSRLPFDDWHQVAAVSTALDSIWSLGIRSLHSDVKAYRPHMLVLTGRPMHRPHLLALAAHMTKKGHGLLSVGDVVYAGDGPLRSREWPKAVAARYVRERALTGYLLAASPVTNTATYSNTIASSFREGARSLLTSNGIGVMRPNTVMLGFKSDWRNCDSGMAEDQHAMYRRAVSSVRTKFGLSPYPSSEREGEGEDGEYSVDEGTRFAAEEYVGVLRDAASLGYGLVVARNLDPLYSTHAVSDVAFVREPGTTEDPSEFPPLPRPPSIPILAKEPVLAAAICNNRCRRLLQRSLAQSGSMPLRYPTAQAARDEAKAFKNSVGKRPPSRIDLVWMVDDGGLCLLLPYLLNKHAAFRHCNLRVLTTSTPGPSNDIAPLTSLLKEFRIEGSVATIDYQALLGPCMLDHTMRVAQMSASMETKEVDSNNARERERERDVCLMNGLPENGSLTQLPPNRDEYPTLGVHGIERQTETSANPTILSLFAQQAVPSVPPVTEGEREGEREDPGPLSLAVPSTPEPIPDPFSLPIDPRAVERVVAEYEAQSRDMPSVHAATD